MTNESLPIPASDLAEALSGVIQGDIGEPVNIVVGEVELHAADDRTQWFWASLTITPSHRNVEVWTWQLPLTEVEMGMPAETLILTIRANMEEWWHMKDLEPEIAQMGRRVS